MRTLELTFITWTLAAAAVGCSSTQSAASAGTTPAAPDSQTTFVSSWKSPTAQPLHVKGARVAAVVLMSDLAARRTAEDKLASELTARGATGVPMYSLVDQSSVEGEPLAREALAHGDVQGVVVMHPEAAQQEPKAVDYTQAPYNSYWSGYYTYGWASPWQVDTEPQYETVVSVETLIYSLKQNQLVWAGRSKTTNPGSLTDLISELAGATANELSHLALVAN